MSDGDLADLFAIPDFWKQSSWHQPQPPLAAPEQEDGFFRLTIGDREPVVFFLGTDDAPHELARGKDPFFQIPTALAQHSSAEPVPEPTIKQSGDGSTAQGSSPSAVSIKETADTAAVETSLDTIVDDYLLFPDAHPLPPVPPTYQTWESLEHTNLGQIGVPDFATEQGPAFVDALVGAGGAPSSPQFNPVVNTGAYCGSLLALALGRSSVLFAWDKGKKAFRATVGNGVRISGFTAAALRSVEKTCLACGNDTRFLCAFVDGTYAHTAGKAAALHAASTPSRVALARCIEGLLLTLQRELGSWGQQSTARSLLQLQARIRPVASLVAFVRGLVTRLSRTAATSAANSASGTPAEVPDEVFLSLLFQEAQATEHGAVFVRDVTKQILQLVSTSWLAFVGAWIGLAPDSKATLWSGSGVSTGKGFVRLDDRVWVDDVGVELAEPDYFLDAAKMPTFIPEEMAQALFATGRNLRFLWTNHPDHPLSNPAAAALRDPATAPLPLQWQFDWDAVHALERRAHAYEQGWSRLLADFGRKGTAPHQQQPGPPGALFPPNAPITQSQSRAGAVAAVVPPQPSIPSYFLSGNAAQIEDCIEASMVRMDSPLAQPVENELAVVLRQQLFAGSRNSYCRHRGKSKNVPGVEETAEEAAVDADALADVVGALAPHWSLLPLLSFGPVIAAQARLVNGACVRLLFDVHGLRQHLQLQRDFQLLGNGVFCSRLSHALFDPDLVDDGGGGGGGGGGSVLGLRLAGRRKETWPPASSELRLALMGVIAESAFGYSGFSGANKTSSDARKQELPGGMSFAVRDLSPDEMDRCMDPDGVEALDFLRLAYKPPPALMAVITPAILGKYDRVFRLLLRVLRMYYVVNQLAKSSSRSRRRASNGKHARDVSTRFRIEARHFVANVMGYFLDTGVGMAWRRLEDWLDDVQQDLAKRDSTANARSSSSSSSSNRRVRRGPVPGPEQLCARHEQTLDEILLVLLLRKRQQPLQQLLQDIFGLILAFAKSVRAEESEEDGDGDGDGDDDERAERIKKMHASFRKKVAAFLAVCRGLSEKEADSVARKDYQQQQQYQDGSRAGEGSALSILLLMLDYNGAYTAAASSRSRPAR